MQPQHTWSEAALKQALGHVPPGPGPPWHAQHKLQLASAYATCLGREPPFTSHNCKTHETLDYIFFSRTPLAVPAAPPGGVRAAWRLEARAALQVPSHEAVRGGGPNWAMPSDHVSLLADFAVVPA